MPTDCGPVPSVPNATPTRTSPTIEDTVIEYECDSTHYLQYGPVLMRCYADGVWHGPSYDCYELCECRHSISFSSLSVLFFFLFFYFPFVVVVVVVMIIIVSPFLMRRIHLGYIMY